MTPIGIQDDAGNAPTRAAAPRISDVLAPERVKVPLQGTDKETVLSELVDLVVRSLGLDAEREAVHAAVLEREGVLSTGIGEGIALPHARYGGLDDLAMAAGVSREPVDYGSLDAEPVRLFFLMLGPEVAAGSQVRLLARVSRLMRDEALRKRLVAADDAGQFLGALREWEGSA
jgi:PTS system nitrogen regulatory IIA component